MFLFLYCICLHFSILYILFILYIFFIFSLFFIVLNTPKNFQQKIANYTYYFSYFNVNKSSKFNRLHVFIFYSNISQRECLYLSLQSINYQNSTEYMLIDVIFYTNISQRECLYLSLQIITAKVQSSDLKCLI